MVVPREFRVLTSSHRRWRDCVSKPAVGSSRKRTEGSCNIEHTMAAFLFHPPDRSAIFLSMCSPRPRVSESSFTRSSMTSFGILWSIAWYLMF